jgi:hypothetical protein
MKSSSVQSTRPQQVEAIMRDIEADIAEIVSDIVVARVEKQAMPLSRVTVRRKSKLAKRQTAA